MRQRLACVSALGLAAALAAPANGATIYNNLTPNNQIAIATRPESAGIFEIEAADDFVLISPTMINMASFIGLLTPGNGSPSISDLVVEIYRVFPADSDTTRTPTVPTRLNSPSDVAFDSRGVGQLTFTTSVLAASFMALNSVQPGGIEPSPNQTTGGNGPITGQQVRFDVTFTSPFILPPDHYFFVPLVGLTNGGQFYWLSASRPISGAGTTPIAPDLQAWTRDSFLDPDWLRVGQDIVGGATPPMFNAAFSLDGTAIAAIPEPSTALLILAGLGLIVLTRRTSAQ
jgi:hypothetical protein